MSKCTTSKALALLLLVTILYSILVCAACTTNDDNNSGSSGVNDDNIVTSSSNDEDDNEVNGIPDNAEEVSIALAGSGTPEDPYWISSVEDLKAIGDSTGITSDTYFQLTADLIISDPDWVPIGNKDAPFSGRFDGDGHTIAWDYTATGGEDQSYFGVFGYSTGVIANLTIDGTLNMGSSTGDYVGGVVGYSSGSVYQCVNKAQITASGMDNVGGVVGALESVATAARENPITIQFCGNRGAITGSTCVGGVVGAIYCNYVGNCVIDQCYSKNCLLTVTSSDIQSYGGGLAGYVKGVITNCYANSITLFSLNGGHYLGGLVGLVNGYSTPYGSIENCYANVVNYYGCNLIFDHPFLATAGGTTNAIITNCYWTEEAYDSTGGYFQPYEGRTVGDETYTDFGTWDQYGIIGTDIQWATLASTLGDKFTSTWSCTLNAESFGIGFDVSCGVTEGEEM